MSILRFTRRDRVARSELSANLEPASAPFQTTRGAVDMMGGMVSTVTVHAHDWLGNMNKVFVGRLSLDMV